jgi:hypothetical protein
MNHSQIADLLGRHGFQGHFTISGLAGGANNRVFRIDGDFGPLLVKVYFRHPEDRRDRAASEFAFAQFAWHCGLRCVPEPLACNPDDQVALYRFVTGRRVMADEINDSLLGQALTFYRTLNLHKDDNQARCLPLAAEACFDLSSHMKCVERRIERLRQDRAATSIDRDAHRFVEASLVPMWNAVAERLCKRADASGIAMHDKIASEDRRISPSDFGFHNALLDGSGNLFFLDFEYSGWDDAAKLVCDFFCQPAVPVRIEYFQLFSQAVVSDFTNPGHHLRRISLLLPVYQVKWICIMLNDFLPEANERRRFAEGPDNDAHRKATQLQQARHYLKKIEVPA